MGWIQSSVASGSEHKSCSHPGLTELGVSFQSPWAARSPLPFTVPENLLGSLTLTIVQFSKRGLSSYEEAHAVPRT